MVELGVASPHSSPALVLGTWREEPRAAAPLLLGTWRPEATQFADPRSCGCAGTTKSHSCHLSQEHCPRTPWAVTARGSSLSSSDVLQILLPGTSSALQSPLAGPRLSSAKPHWKIIKCCKTGRQLCFLVSFSSLLFSWFIYFKDFIYLFLERGEKREKEKEGNINVWLPLPCSLLGTWPATQACAPNGNRIGNPLVCRLALSPLSHTS